MNTFNKKSLCVALAATGLVGAAGVAQAVNLSPDGTGNVLIYPYYTVRANGSGNTFNTYLSVVNTTSSTKAIKVRFREGKNSNEVLDFNVFLSPVDVWTAVVYPSDTGAQIGVGDLSCTIPSFTPGVPVPFRNLRYAGLVADGATESLDRTREGYVEILEMATYTETSVIGVNAEHNRTTGRPVDCTKVTDLVAASEARAPSGGLMGMGQLINPGVGASMSYNAVALDNFYPPGPSFYATTGTALPTLAAAATNSAVVQASSIAAGLPVAGRMIVSAGWASGSDAVSAVLMHNAVMNEYVLEPGTLSATDWVVTFPTKKFYVPNGIGAATPPFQNRFNNGACDEVTLALWDREERRPTSGSGPGPDFSPQDPLLPDVARICWEANVITFNRTAPALGVLGSTNVGLNVNTNLVPAPTTDIANNGWLRLGFGFPGARLINNLVGNTNFSVNLATGASTALAAPATYAGLPVVGFNVFSYTNSALRVGTVVANVPVNYGMGVDHKYQTTITP